MANLPVSGVALACALRLPASALRRHCGLCVLPAKQTWRCALRALSVDEANTPHNGLNAFSGGLWRCFAGAAFLPIARSSRKAGRSAACAAQRVWPPSRGKNKTKQNVHVFRFQKTAPFLFCYAKNGRFLVPCPRQGNCPFYAILPSPREARIGETQIPFGGSRSHRAAAPTVADRHQLFTAPRAAAAA